MRQLGVSVPEVVYYENFNQIIGYSYMIISEIKGYPASKIKDEKVLRKVPVEAGKDIAKYNLIEVNGFGYIERNDRSYNKLCGGFRTYQKCYNWLIDQSL